MDTRILLSTTYFGPIRYYSKFLLPGQVVLEKYENYTKQTYRNRCRIYGPNGLVELSVPVKRGSFHKTAMRDLEIDHEKVWQPAHLKTIQAAYRSAPFYEYYIDDIAPFFSDDPQFLWDYNLKIMDTMLTLLKIPHNYTISSGYIRDFEYPEDLDYRETIHPKIKTEDNLYTDVMYHQVFEDRLGFIPDLSILDLLFNTGPDALDILKRSVGRT